MNNFFFFSKKDLQKIANIFRWVDIKISQYNSKHLKSAPVSKVHPCKNILAVTCIHLMKAVLSIVLLMF